MLLINSYKITTMKSASLKNLQYTFVHHCFKFLSNLSLCIRWYFPDLSLWQDVIEGRLNVNRLHGFRPRTNVTQSLRLLSCWGGYHTNFPLFSAMRYYSKFGIPGAKPSHRYYAFVSIRRPSKVVIQKNK